MKNKYWAFALTLLSAAAIQTQEKDSLPSLTTYLYHRNIFLLSNFNSFFDLEQNDLVQYKLSHIF